MGIGFSPGIPVGERGDDGERGHEYVGEAIAKIEGFSLDFVTIRRATA